MATLFVVTSVTARVRQYALSHDRALRLDADGDVARDGWTLSFVPAGAERGAARWCLVVAAGVTAFHRGAALAFGVTPLADRDHVVTEDLEIVFSADALPVRIDADRPCAACCGTPDTDERSGLYRCPRCGLVACDSCWALAPKGRCLTPGCEQPSALDRPLWIPEAADFLLAGTAGEEASA
jgi:hypothetical protein